MEKNIYLKLLTIFLLFPSLCNADMVAPLAFMGKSIYHGIFSGGIFLLIMWVAEAYTIKVSLKDNTKKPLKVSLIANAITTLMGVVYFVLLFSVVMNQFQFSWIMVLFSVLIVPFCITFYTEFCILKKYYETYSYKKLINASLCMNLTTYLLFFIFMWATVGGIGVLMIITPILAYYLVRLFQMYTFEMNIKKHKRYIYSTLIIIITFAVIAVITIGPLAPPEKYSGRERAHDASIKATLAGVRMNAELYYDNNSNSYKELCSDPQTVGNIEQIISKYETSYLCQEDEQRYCISAQLPSTVNYTANYFCVDSTGYAETTLHDYCTDGNYSCSGN